MMKLEEEQYKRLNEKALQVQKADEKLFCGAIISFILAFIILVNCIRPVTISGYSMYPTYNDNDFVFCTTLYKKLNYNDIIIFDEPDEKSFIHTKLIKRVVGLPGDTIAIRGGRLYINGNISRRDLLLSFDSMNEGLQLKDNSGKKVNQITLKEDEYFCLGDNRNNSYDSRYFGAVNSSEVIGKVLQSENMNP